MRVSRLIGTTRRETQASTGTESADLLERAGYVRQLASGIYIYLGLCQRSMQKIERILREEIERIGGVEINMPVVQSADIWKKTKRYETIDDSLVRFKDRSDRDMVLAMTHEEVVSFIAQQEISTYRQLPKLVYQIQTKFRDELRSRAGLIRVREFVMKDSYSLDVDQEGLEAQYIQHYDAYYRIFARMGLPVVSVLSDSGMMGGSMAHEYMYLNENGEDTIFICPDSGYRANKENCTFYKEPPDLPDGPLELVETPGAKTIEDVSAFLQKTPAELGKMVFFAGQGNEETEEKLIAVVVSGNLEVNQIKLKNLLQLKTLRQATAEEVASTGAVPGFASPLGLKREDMTLVVDDLIAMGGGYILGANKVDYHQRNVTYERDYKADVVGDVTSAYEGAPSPKTKTPLEAVRGIEVGNIFQLGTKYSVSLGALFTDNNGKTQPIIMGSYGIGVGRALACIAEEYHDENGLNFPISVAPYHVTLVLIEDGEESKNVAEELYEQFQKEGIEVLYDDRPKKMTSPGVKFKDADLRGIPLRVTVSKRSLKKGGVEFKVRGDDSFSILAVDDVLDYTKQQIQALFDKIDAFVASQQTWESEKSLWDK